MDFSYSADKSTFSFVKNHHILYGPNPVKITFYTKPLFDNNIVILDFVKEGCYGCVFIVTINNKDNFVVKLQPIYNKRQYDHEVECSRLFSNNKISPKFEISGKLDIKSVQYIKTKLLCEQNNVTKVGFIVMQKLYEIPYNFFKSEDKFQILRKKMENIIDTIDKLKFYMDDLHMNNFMLSSPNSLDVLIIDFGEVEKSKQSTSKQMLTILDNTIKKIKSNILDT